MAWDEATGKTGYFVITDTISHVDPSIVLLTLDGETLETTAEHPFYVVTNSEWLPHFWGGRWVDAGALQIGDDVLQADGSTGEVRSVRVVVQRQPMYNLTVDQAHTFFVGQGQWLVHNASPCNVSFSVGKLQHEGKHAKDFGLSGNWNKANGELFQQTLTKFIETAPQSVTGTFRKTINVTHHYDPSTNLWVAVDSAGNYVASWKLDAVQVADLLKNGNVQ